MRVEILFSLDRSSVESAASNEMDGISSSSSTTTGAFYQQRPSEWKSRSAAAVAATASVLLPHFYAIAGGRDKVSQPNPTSTSGAFAKDILFNFIRFIIIRSRYFWVEWRVRKPHAPPPLVCVFNSIIDDSFNDVCIDVCGYSSVWRQREKRRGRRRKYCF